MFPIKTHASLTSLMVWHSQTSTNVLCCHPQFAVVFYLSLSFSVSVIFFSVILYLVTWWTGLWRNARCYWESVRYHTCVRTFCLNVCTCDELWAVVWNSLLRRQVSARLWFQMWEVFVCEQCGTLRLLVYTGICFSAQLTIGTSCSSHANWASSISMKL